MNLSWWPDLVDERFSQRLEECRAWMRDRTYDDFAVTIIIPMEGDGGHWAAWIRIAPLPAELDGGFRILVDGDSAGWAFGVTPTLTLGRGLEAPEPGRKRHEVTILAGFDGDIIEPPITADNTIEYCMIRLILRRGTESKSGRREGPGLAQELSDRHGGENLRRTGDGLWSFTLRA